METRDTIDKFVKLSRYERKKEAYISVEYGGKFLSRFHFSLNIEKPFVTARFGDTWKEHAKAFLVSDLIKIMMKITNNNPDKIVGGLTTGKIRWTTITDDVWDSDKEIEFDITADDKWRLYTINVGPERYWVGYINNLRIYPFTDGWEKDQFAIKYIKIPKRESNVIF